MPKNDRDYFAEFGTPAWRNGYHAIPVEPGQKRITLKTWSVWCGCRPREDQVLRWSTRYAGHSVGIACGASVVAVDLDEDEPNRANALHRMTELFLGKTPLVRFGRTPRRVLVYRVDGMVAVPSRGQGSDLAGVQILGHGRQFVGFGVHPGTGQPYRWVGASPATLPVVELPGVTPEQVRQFVGALELLSGRERSDHYELTEAAFHTLPKQRLRPFQAGPWRIEADRVVDGRDSYLAHLVWCAARAGLTDPREIAEDAWMRFTQTTCLKRGRRGSSRTWSLDDALTKARALVANGKAHTALTTCESGALKRFRQRASEAQSEGREDAFWNSAAKDAFALAVQRAASKRKLSPCALAVSEHMLGLVYEGGACFASIATLAEATGSSQDHVKRAKRQLRERRFWLTYRQAGGKGNIAYSIPNPAVLSGEHEAAEQPHTQTVATSDTRISQVGRGATSPDDPDFSTLLADPPRLQDERPFLPFE